MGQIDSILAFLGRMLPYTARYIAGFLKFILLYAILVCSWSLLAGTGPSFAQSCTAGAVQVVNDNLELPGRKGRDVLQIKFNSISSIICRPRFGDAQNSLAGSIRITHCTPGNTTDLCFAMRQNTVLQSASIFGPGLVGGLSVASDSPVDLSAGTYQVAAIVNGDTVGFSFRIAELAEDNQRIVPETIPISVSLPSVSIANTTETLEAGTNGLITISQTVLSSADNVISYTVTGTATSGTDYTALSGSLTIPSGATTANIPIVPIADSLAEGDESVIVTLTEVTSGSATLGTSLSATNTIIDDDAATVSIANTANTLESGTNGVFTVTQSTTSTTDTIIAYSVAGTATAGTDYTKLSGSVTISAGDTIATLAIAVIGDTLLEGNETVIVTLTRITAGSATLGTSLEATNTLIDDDVGLISIENTTDALESGTNGLLTVNQTVTSTSNTVISYSISGTATPGADYSALSGSLSIFAGDTSAKITVPVLDDNISEGDETVIITLTAVTSGLAKFGTSTSATNTILDDDVDINKLVAQKFRTQVHNYVSRRMSLQSRSSPSIHRRFLNGAPAQKNQSGNLDINGNSSGVSGSFSFVNSLANRGPECDTCNNPFFWFEAEFSFFRDNDLSDEAVQSSGNYYIGYAGFSLPVDEYLTVGIMGQIDRFEDNLDNDLGQATGTGWAIGPYISTKVLDDLRLDIRGLWGASTNKTSQLVLSRNFSGSFDTERWIVEAVLSGRNNIDEYSVIPSARIFYMNENWDDYTVSDGNRLVSVGGDSTEIGNLSAALEINKTIQNDDFILKTFLSGEVFWKFQDPGIISTSGTNEQNDDFSASISAGIGITKQSGNLSLEVTYDGLGGNGLESIGGSLTLSHRF